MNVCFGDNAPSDVQMDSSEKSLVMATPVKGTLFSVVRFKNSVLTTFPNLVKIDETLGITTVMLC